MRVKMEIRPAVQVIKKGWFGKTELPIHEVVITELEFTNQEKKFFKDAGILEHSLGSFPLEAAGQDRSKANEGMLRLYPDWRQPVFLGPLMDGTAHSMAYPYLSLPEAQTALQEFQASFRTLKNMYDNSSNPSANKFEL